MDAGLILAVETSCDETAVAIARGDGEILYSEVASQIELHSPYGGVVPELASRNHSLDLRPLLERALEKAALTWPRVDVLAATAGPGLASSLLVGDTTAKAIALGLGRPFYSINHMEGHLLSPFIASGRPIEPHVALIASGGHTLIVKVDGVSDYRVMGSTKDDAAGEAFDKVGKMLGLAYPGGPEVARMAEGGAIDAFRFPRSMMDSGDFQFSFSGLKTSARYALEKLGQPLSERTLRDFCASFQEAVVDVLVTKLFAAAKAEGSSIATVSGGVSCNERLRIRAKETASASGIELVLAAPAYSTDNAAMIAYAAAKRREAGIPGSPFDRDIDPNLKLEGVIPRVRSQG
ncbi:MAG: tRNA (adenosine(37)-N6)-threonylcarbamoyltransferase complex transferase subunit TsaD [Verrucomicrobiales bacterium]